MGKWTEIAKTLPKRQEDETPWRLKVNAIKDASRAKPTPEVLSAYRDLRAKKEALEAEVSALNAHILAAEELLADAYQSTGRETPFYFEDGARVEVNDAVAFQVEDSEKLMAWVHQEKLERLLSLPAPTRDSIARQRLEGNQSLPDGMKASAYSQVRFVSPRKK